jgi:hypothetical protein
VGVRSVVKHCTGIPCKTKKKGSAVARAAFWRIGADYFAVVLPKRLRKRSTRPPMLSTDFCVPV